MELIAGSSFMGWLVAIALKKHDNSKQVVLTNFGSKIGGNSQSFKFKNQFVDRGMQTFYECGISWADELIKEALTAANIDFNEFVWPWHDPCMTWQHGRLYSSVYPVHQSGMSINEYQQAFAKLRTLHPKSDGLKESIVCEFGEDIWHSVFRPIAEKFTVGNVNDLSIASIAPLPMDRISAPQLSDKELADKKELLSRIAFSSPESIPSENYKKRSTIYPKHGGIASLVVALKALAEKYGVEIWDNLAWSDLQILDGQLVILDFKPDKVFWTLPNRRLSMLTPDSISVSPPSPFTGCHVAVFCEKGFKAQKAHYLLSFDDDPIFRVTFYGNLAGDHAASYASVELLIAPEKINKIEITKFFKKAGLIDNDAECEFSAPTLSPWPISFNKGYIHEREIEEQILKKKIVNLVLLNSNPAKSSMMQTPTLSNRLRMVKFL